MTDPPRPNRRIGDGGRADTARAREAHLVRVIAADPVKVTWLSRRIARSLGRVADLIGETSPECAALVRAEADRYRNGEINPFL